MRGAARNLNVFIAIEDGLRELFPITDGGIRPVRMFAHYVGDDRAAIRSRFARVHENVLYESASPRAYVLPWAAELLGLPPLR